MTVHVRLIRFLPMGALLLVFACTPPPPPPDDDTQTTEAPKGTDCAANAIACYDEFARQPARIICFREQSRWSQAQLTWRLAEPLAGLSEADQLDLIERALSIWADASTLSFTRVEQNADLNISFVRLDHGDSFPFDGPGQNLGHAFFPGSPSPGEVHLCADENWSIDDAGGEFDLFTAVLHELGHALGLEHSLDADAVMAPSYGGAKNSLTDDDIDAIQLLYGSPGGEVPPIIERPDDLDAFCADAGDLTALNDPDSDDDGIPDTVEVFVLGTEPFTGDSDQDGTADFTEVFVDRTDPSNSSDVRIEVCTLNVISFTNPLGDDDKQPVNFSGDLTRPRFSWPFDNVAEFFIATSGGVVQYGIFTAVTNMPLPHSVRYGQYNLSNTEPIPGVPMPAPPLGTGVSFIANIVLLDGSLGAVLFELRGTDCPAFNATMPPDDNMNPDDSRTFVDAAVLHEGYEQIVAGANVDPLVSTVIPAGYGVADWALSGNGQKVWFVLFDEFPNVSSDPQVQVWSVNTDGTGGLRSPINNPMLESGTTSIDTNIDGSVAIVENANQNIFTTTSPGVALGELFDADDFEAGCARGVFRLADDASRFLYVDFCGTRVFEVELNTSLVEPLSIAFASSFVVNDFSARSTAFELDIAANGTTWTMIPEIFDANQARPIQPIMVGMGLSQPIIAQQQLPLDTRFPRSLNMTDDGLQFGYCIDPPGLGQPNECYVQTVGSIGNVVISDGVTPIGDLALSDDGRRAYFRSSIQTDISSSHGYLQDVGAPTLRLSGTQRFSDGATPAFAKAKLSDNGLILAAGVGAGVYVLHDQTASPIGFPTIDRVQLAFDDANCDLIVRAEITAPSGVERVYALPMYDGREPTTIVPSDENALFTERGGGGVNLSTTFGEVESGVWERTVHLTNGAGACVQSALDAHYALRIIVVDENATRSIFKDVGLAP